MATLGNLQLQRAERSVFGYIRQQQLLLKSAQFPSAICDLCVLFYLIREFWAGYDELSIQVSKTQDIMTNLLRGDQDVEVEKGTFEPVAYGNVQTDVSFHGIYKWKFNIIDIGEFDILQIGLESGGLSIKYVPDASDEAEHDEREYRFRSGGQYRTDNSHHPAKVEYDDTFGDRGWCTGDTVEMELNMAAKTLKLMLNEQDKGVVHEEVDVSVSYHMAMISFVGGSIVQIVDFQQISL